jgi:hypothetical protein
MSASQTRSGRGHHEALDHVGAVEEVVAAVRRPPSPSRGLTLDAHIRHQPSYSLPVDRPALASEHGRQPSIAIGWPPGGQPSERSSEPPLINGRGGVVVDAAAGPAGRATDQPDRLLGRERQDDLPSRLRAEGSQAEALFATFSSMVGRLTIRSSSAMRSWSRPR